MLQIRKMTGADAKTVLPMVYGFYRSDAVDHAVPEETLNRTFQAAVTDGSLLRDSFWRMRPARWALPISPPTTPAK